MTASWRKTALFPPSSVLRFLSVLIIGSSLVGLIGFVQLRDENRLDRFVPPHPELYAAERRFHQAFGSDLYLPISVHLTHRIKDQEQKQIDAFFQAIASLPRVEQALTPASPLAGFLTFSLRVTAESIKIAVVRCGPGMYESSWILAAGFAVVMFSEFLPVRHFGLLATTGVLRALVGDMLIFPSVITCFSLLSSTEVQQ